MSRKTLLAVASGGGHWEQLMQLSPAFADFNVVYACTNVAQAVNSGAQDPIALRDYNKWQPGKVIGGIFECLALVRAVRPSVVVSTGAAPGLVALLWGRLLGARTVWIDSIANAEKLSLSGQLSTYFAHTTLTQWEHLANGQTVTYIGGIL